MWKIRLRSFLATAIVSVAGLMPGTAPSAAPIPKVICCLVCDTTKAAGLGESVGRDKRNIRRLFQENVPQRQLEIHEVSEENMTPKGIMAMLKELHVERHNDSVVFCYAGHGAYDETRGHFFVLQGDLSLELLRRDVEKEIFSKTPRTAVFVTDCCAALWKYQPGARAIDLTPPVKAKVISPLFRYLLFERRGTVSITSAKPGEIAMGNESGGLFTFAFVHYMHVNSQQTLSWDKVLEDVGAKVKQEFADSYSGFSETDRGELEKRNQHTQTLYTFIETPALGARVKESHGKLTVVKVVPLSPAQQAGIKNGDVLLKINDKEIRTEGEYGDAVDHSPREMHLTVRGPKGRIREAAAQLNK